MSMIALYSTYFSTCLRSRHAVWKLRKFSLTLFWQKIRESKSFTKELISRVFFSVREIFSFFHTVWNRIITNWFNEIILWELYNFLHGWKEELGFATWRLDFIPRDELHSEGWKNSSQGPKARGMNFFDLKNVIYPEGWNQTAWRLQNPLLPDSSSSAERAKQPKAALRAKQRN